MYLNVILKPFSFYRFFLQETLTFADSTLSNSLFDDNQNPLAESTLSQHHMFLTLDNAFTDEFEKMKRIANEVQHFCTIDSQGNSYGEIITIENNTISATQNSELTNNNSSAINNNIITEKTNKNRGGIKVSTKKYKKSMSNSNMLNNNNDTSAINNNLKNAMNSLSTTNSSKSSSVSVMAPNPSSLSPGAGTVCNGIRKERSLHYCAICNKGFKDKYSVNVHHRTHTGKVETKSFKTSNKIKYNVGEKPFSCSLCGKNFRQKAHLAKHYQTHLQKSTSGTSKSKHQQKQSVINTQPQPIAQTSNHNVINV